MEDEKPSAADASTESETKTRDCDATEARLVYLCKNGLSLDDNTYTQTSKLFNETRHLLSANASAIGSGTPDEAERFWFAFVLYSVKRLSEKNRDNMQQGSNDNDFNLCQILRVTKLNFVDFFKELPQFVVKADRILRNIYGADWENKLEAKELQANFEHLSHLSKHYKRTYQDFFLPTDASCDKQSDVTNATGYVSDYHRFGWLLFLGLCVHAFGRFKDLVTCTNGLASILRKFDSMASPMKTVTSPLSPRPSPAPHTNGIVGGATSNMAATPVSTSMDTAKWLRTVIIPLPSKPSAELERFMKSCDRDVTSDVIRRAEIILEAIFPSLGERCVTGSLQSEDLTDSEWAEQRRVEALKFYYKVLKAICIRESQILQTTNLTSLLTSERFHRCMLACSAELVLATYKTVALLFPVVLDKTGITAFDLSKVIESFILHEESLPGELRRHLNSLEERLLERMVWEKGSSMYNSLTVARPSLSAEINRLGLLADPMPSLDAIALHINFSSGGLPPVSSLQKRESSAGQKGDIMSPKRPCTNYRSVLVERNTFTSPVKDRLLAFNKSKLLPPPLQSAFASPTRPNPGGGGETYAETGINKFFSKISKLAAVRINGLVERLQLTQRIRESVYCLFQKILSQLTSLFFNRHIDEIILSCFYVVAKISKLNLTLREIIYTYRRQPLCKPQVFDSVFVDWSSVRENMRIEQDHIHMVTFYNEVFIPTVSPLLELGPDGMTTETNRASEVNNNNDGQCPESPKVSCFPTLPDMSPKRVSAAHNVYVSPLKMSKRDALMSRNSSKIYYACFGEKTHPFQSPSKDLRDINDLLKGFRNIRGTLNFDDVDRGLVSDSMVVNTLYFHDGNGASSSGVVKTEQPDEQQPDA